MVLKKFYLKEIKTIFKFASSKPNLYQNKIPKFKQRKPVFFLFNKPNFLPQTDYSLSKQNNTSLPSNRLVGLDLTNNNVFSFSHH